MPQGPTYSTYWVRVPTSGVGYVQRTVAPQVMEGMELTLEADDPESFDEIINLLASLFGSVC